MILNFSKNVKDILFTVIGYLDDAPIVLMAIYKAIMSCNDYQ